MKKLKELSTMWLVTIISAFVTVISALITIPFKVNAPLEITFGILLGGLTSSLCFLFYALTENIKGEKAIKVTITLIAVSTLLHAGAIILAALLYFKAQVYIFNVFATFGSVFIGLIVLIIVSLARRNKDK